MRIRELVTTLNAEALSKNSYESSMNSKALP